MDAVVGHACTIHAEAAIGLTPYSGPDRRRIVRSKTVLPMYAGALSAGPGDANAKRHIGLSENAKTLRNVIRAKHTRDRINVRITNHRRHIYPLLRLDSAARRPDLIPEELSAISILDPECLSVYAPATILWTCALQFFLRDLNLLRRVKSGSQVVSIDVFMSASE
jgi:hypothetical protein